MNNNTLATLEELAIKVRQLAEPWQAPANDQLPEVVEIEEEEIEETEEEYHQPLGGTRSAYYRTKAFNVNVGHNPIVNAAGPLLSFAAKLRQLTAQPDLSQLHHDLIHEIKAFEMKLQKYHYPASTLMAARYALCALLDETICSTSWGKYSNWQTHRLMSTFQEETQSGEKFFLILRRSCDEPQVHVDLLELMYLCLALGFEGNYRYVERGHQELSELLDDLYHIIRGQREEFNNKLSPTQQKTTAPIKQRQKLMPLLLLSALVTTLLAIIYSGFAYELNHASAPIDQVLEQWQVNESTVVGS